MVDYYGAPRQLSASFRAGRRQHRGAALDKGSLGEIEKAVRMRTWAFRPRTTEDVRINVPQLAERKDMVKVGKVRGGVRRLRNIRRTAKTLTSTRRTG